VRAIKGDTIISNGSQLYAYSYPIIIVAAVMNWARQVGILLAFGSQVRSLGMNWIG